jgi:apolipoprotein N-acyltransferase
MEFFISKPFVKLPLAILGGILFYLAWYPNIFWPFAFVGFVPIFIIEENCNASKQNRARSHFWFYAFIFTFTWNILTTWWIGFASVGGASLAIILNSLLMSFVLLIFHRVKLILASWVSFIFFIVIWLSFEYLHLNWDMSWPWLSLGNVFSNATLFIQWYEYTGVQGGSLLILIINILIFNALTKKSFLKMNAIIVTVIILSLLCISYFLYTKPRGVNGKSLEIVLAQPNIDPYNEKFSGEGNLFQLKKCISSVKNLVTDSTDFLIAPETAIPLNIWEEDISSSDEICYLRNYSSKYSHLSIVLGASTTKLYNTRETATSRPIPNSPYYYDSYNTALQIFKNEPIALYHKSKLVPGVEIIPFPSVMKYFEKYAIDLGGTMGSLGTQENRTVFTNPHNEVKVAPIICYESIYSEFVSEYVRNGANFLCIITNDGWWENTAGYRQHLYYSRLRAIENRRFVARSANTGISAFIDDRGEILQQSKWSVVSGLKQSIKTNHNLTFYTKHGDYIYKFAVLSSILLSIFTIIIKIRNRNVQNL